MSLLYQGLELLKQQLPSFIVKTAVEKMFDDELNDDDVCNMLDSLGASAKIFGLDPETVDQVKYGLMSCESPKTVLKEWAKTHLADKLTNQDAQRVNIELTQCGTCSTWFPSGTECPTCGHIPLRLY